MRKSSFVKAIVRRKALRRASRLLRADETKVLSNTWVLYERARRPPGKGATTSAAVIPNLVLEPQNGKPASEQKCAQNRLCGN